MIYDMAKWWSSTIANNAFLYNVGKDADVRNDDDEDTDDHYYL